MPKVAVILSGCGFMDGAEVRESVLSLLYLDEEGAEVSMFAPDIDQTKVVNHLSGEEEGAARNVLVESARIARGDITPLAELNAASFDALVIPGGFGVALNLSDFAVNGPDAAVHPDLQRIIRAFLDAGKPVGAICIAPAVVAAAAKGANLTMTIGEDEGTAGAIVTLGHYHQDCATDKAVLDAQNNIASCSAYMRGDARISDVAKGIRSVIKHVLEIADQQRKAA